MDTMSSQPRYPSDMTDPRLLDGVRTRRIIAFLIDIAMITALVVVGAIVVFFLGIITFGLGFLFYSLLVPAVALIYNGMTLSSPSSATIGMRMTGIKMTLKTGDRPDFITGAIHALLFYVSVSILTPFIVLFSLINVEKRLLHDILIGAVIVRAD